MKHEEDRAQQLVGQGDDRTLVFLSHHQRLKLQLEDGTGSET